MCRGTDVQMCSTPVQMEVFDKSIHSGVPVNATIMPTIRVLDIFLVAGGLAGVLCS